MEHHGATNKTEMKYEISRKKTLFYKESVVYPLVSFREEIKSNQKHFIFIKKVEYVDVVEYVNHYGMSIFTVVVRDLIISSVNIFFIVN